MRALRGLAAGRRRLTVVLVVVVLTAATALVLVSIGVFNGQSAVIHPPTHSGPIPVPAALEAGGASGQVVVTPNQATAMVHAWWPVAEEARAQNDIAVTDAVSTGPAAAFDDGVSRDNLVRGGDLRQVRPLLDVRTIVPYRTSYPGYFLAEVLTTTNTGADAPNDAQNRYQELLVFVRPNGSTPWKVGLDTGVTGGAWPVFDAAPADQAGYDADPSGPFPVTPEQVPASMANYVQYEVDTGRAPLAMQTLVDPGYWTDTEPQSEFKDWVALREQDLVETWHYSADTANDGFYQFAVEKGAQVSDLVCFTLRYQRTVDGLGRTVIQDDKRADWGGWLAPGHYAGITISGLRQTCALVTPGARIALDGGNGGIVAVAGRQS